MCDYSEVRFQKLCKKVISLFVLNEEEKKETEVMWDDEKSIT